MGIGSFIGTIIFLITGLITYKGFADDNFKRRYLFNVDGILIGRQYDRMISSGFLHANWFHFAFNMIGLLSFSFALEDRFGSATFAFLYFISLVGGSLLALYIHRNHGDYSALGASGAVSGIIASSIILYPDSNLSFIILPYEIKSWILGVLFILISIFGIKSQKDNIGHDAHLGGALTGILVTLILDPSIIKTNWWIILLMLIPTILFLVLIVRNPAVLMIDQYWGENLRRSNFKSKKVISKKEKEASLNDLLDKIKNKGINSLTDKERKRLEDLKDNI